tara:strand:- start:256 stop:624 length:369 start_codon:yes stop_codon:yes gene_type:complete
MDRKDVDNILDIPDIEQFLDNVFTLNIYDFGDKVLYYEYLAPLNGVSCQIAISLDKNPYSIEGKTKLSDLLIIDDVGMIDYTTGIMSHSFYDSEFGCFMSDFSETFQRYWYRPFLNKEEREY